MNTTNRARRNGSAKAAAQQVQTTADKFDLVQDPPESGIFFLESLSGERTRITLEQARDHHLRHEVPKALRDLIGPRAGNLQALENVVLESKGLFAMLEAFLNESIAGDHAHADSRAERIVAGIYLLTDGFKDRLAAAFDSFYPNSQVRYARKEQGT